MSLTSEQLNDVAWALDALTKLSRSLLEPISKMDKVNAATMEVTVEVTTHGEPISSTDARTLLEWLDGDEMQNDLRAEAKQRSEAVGMYWCEKHATLIECDADCDEPMKPVYLMPMYGAWDGGEEE
jgi:hypothetical protein